MYIIFFALVSNTCLSADNWIKVIGSSKVSVTPDIIKLTLAITQQGKDLPGLKTGIDEKSAKVAKLCSSLGVPSKDISSSEISIRPNYNYETKDFLGYEISREIRVTLKNLDKYPELVNGSISAGITDIREVSLDTTKRNELELEALNSASNSARLKAQAIANSNNLLIDKVISVEESGIPNDERLHFASKIEGGGNFEPGEISLISTIIVTYSTK